VRDIHGGPAFPSDHETSRMIHGEKYPDAMTGMSLRDYFAGQALVGLNLNGEAYGWAPSGMASRAYAIADAMLMARTE